jgi:hypothetical protein
VKLASLDGRFARARNLYHGVSGRVKTGEDISKLTYTALLFLLAMHSKAGGRSGVGWGCDELGKGRALTKERIGMQSERGLWGFWYEMQRQLWLPSGFSSASLETEDELVVVFRVPLAARSRFRYLILSSTSSEPLPTRKFVQFFSSVGMP